MQIIEQNVVPKNPQKKSEDGIVVTDDYIAVIDGSTSKSDRRYSLFSSNGRYAMNIIARYLSKSPKDLSCRQFCLGATRAVARHYRKSQLQRLLEHPEDRLTASCIVFSRLRREIWMVGDCQCLLTARPTDVPVPVPVSVPVPVPTSPQYFDNPKPYEQELADQRADIIRNSNLPPEHFLTDDTARAAIIPRMLEFMQQQNKTYAVVDGFPIPQSQVRVITLDFQPWEVVLASDGYPFLEPTLEASEARLARQRATDPLNIGQFKATKAFARGNNSFDDRAYIRFRV
jgi:glycerophosphoryl diester phosphodiesterase